MQLGVVDRCECVAIGRHLAQALANRLRIAIAWELAIGTRRLGNAIDPIPAIALLQQPAAERFGLRLDRILVTVQR